jgi:hypothetical protein
VHIVKTTHVYTMQPGHRLKGVMTKFGCIHMHDKPLDLFKGKAPECYRLSSCYVQCGKMLCMLAQQVLLTLIIAEERQTSARSTFATFTRSTVNHPCAMHKTTQSQSCQLPSPVQPPSTTSQHCHVQQIAPQPQLLAGTHTW